MPGPFTREIPTDGRTMQRFWAKVRVPVEPDGCMVWTGAKNNKGYGQLWVGSQTDGTARKVLAHRVAFTALVGPIPDGREVDHACGNPSCVRPDHLRLASHAENMRYARRRADNTSGFRGVYFDKTRGKWKAHIRVDGCLTTIGRYPTAEDAARAYDDAARKHYGKFARLNFPRPGEASAHVPPVARKPDRVARNEIAKILSKLSEGD